MGKRQMERQGEPGTLWGDVAGGAAAAVIGLPVAISCGWLAFAPLGPGYAASGALAGMYCGAIVSFVAAFAGGSPLQISGPKSSMAVVMAALLGTLAVEPSIAPRDAVFAIFVCVILAGAFQILFGLLRLGSVIKVIPYPVTVGFMNGLAIIIVESQIPVLFGGGMPGTGGAGTRLLPDVALIAGATAVAMPLARRWLTQSGDAIVAMVVGGAVAMALVGMGHADIGTRIGAVPDRLPMPVVFEHLFAAGFSSTQWETVSRVLPTALVLALLGSFESLLGATVLESRLDVRYASNRELIGQGLANVISGGFGGLAGGGSPTRGLASYGAGGRTRLAGGVNGLAFLAMIAAAPLLIAHIPLAVTSGLLCVYAIRLADNWTRPLLVSLYRDGFRNASSRQVINLAIILVVTILTVTTNMVSAVAFGLIAAAFAFVFTSSQAPVFRIYRGNSVRSKNARSMKAMATLSQTGHAIAIVEAQGAIFFGSSERLAEQVERLADDANFIIVDLVRVTEIDATGGYALTRLASRLARRGKRLLVSHAGPDTPAGNLLRDATRALSGNDVLLFADLDGALTWAENAVLQDKPDTRPDEATLETLEAFAGLTAEQRDRLKPYLHTATFDAGDRIIEEGVVGDAMYFLLRGTVSVSRVHEEGSRPIRLAGIGPGLTFGEMALLGLNRRTADIHADSDIACYRLPQNAFDEICRDHADIGVLLLKNLAKVTAFRLDLTSEEVSTLSQ